MFLTTSRVARIAAALVALIAFGCSPDEPSGSSTPVVVPAGPLRVSSANGRYFTDASGRAIYLTGSHTWNNLQDASNSAVAFSWPAYLDFLAAHHHNFTRLWTWEHTRWPDAGISYAPMPFKRVGPDMAIDGAPKFDLTQFDQTYFDRLHQRAADAAARGIYVSVMLFNGWSVEDNGEGNPWPVHMFNRANNINDVDGDPNGDGQGIETQTLQVAAITAIQDAYVRKVVDAVNDLDNVLYEISNESRGGSAEVAWQAHMIQLIHTYEAAKPKRHPVGMTALYPNGSDADLFASAADFVSPALGGQTSDVPAADGHKVILLDTDHLCGICGDAAWVWKSLTRGVNPVFMDVYNGSYGPPGAANPNDPNWVAVRANMGYALGYARRVNLMAMTPRDDLSSTGYCLANPIAQGAEYLVFAPSGGSITVDVSAAAGSLSVEWFFPESGQTKSGESITGGTTRTLMAPASGAAVLYIH